jgi:aromatic ring-opening dioxygenase catalytic subunit (LigB family)
MDTHLELEGVLPAAELTQMPTVFIPHGGGPCFFMEWNPPDMWSELQNFLVELPGLLPAHPTAIVVISAHNEASPITISAGEHPHLLYDYSGFPPHTYQLTYPAPGNPVLAAKIHALLAAADITSHLDPHAPWDHGVFVPLKVSWPEANIPVVSVSLHPSLDPELHLAIGRALRELRKEGVLIIGSGFNVHGAMSGGTREDAIIFDGWLRGALDDQSTRSSSLRNWLGNPVGRGAHPREEHLIPLMVCVGAAEDEPSALIHDGLIFGVPSSGWSFGS